MTDQKKLTQQIIRYYWRHAWRYKSYVLGLFTMVPITVFIFQFMPPLIVSTILSKISKGDFLKGNLWESFGTELLAYAACSLIGGVILWRINVILIWKLEMNILRDIQQEVFDHLNQMSATFHANRFGGSLVSQAQKLGGAYVRFADTTVFGILPLLLAFVYASIILTRRAPLVALFLILFSIAFMVSAIYITRYIRKLNTVEAAVSNKQTGFLADAITNILAIKGFAGIDHERKRFAGATERTRAATHDVMIASIKRDSYFGASTSLLSIGALVLAVMGAVLFSADMATVFLIVTFAMVISENLWDFAQTMLRNYNRALGDAKDMVEILAIEPAVKDPASPEPLRIKEGTITFKKMTFTHGDSSQGDPLFESLNLVIQPGEKVGLVGHSGSGKTTLTRLLLRFSDIDSGEILIDGQNIAHITQDDLRRSIAYVPQEPLLFHRSIRENIAYGKRDASQEEIQSAARKAHAHEFIEKLSNGYDTLVGERGVKLSGGQRQRIAIARAILKDAPILVLDEATSALDSESEKLIQSALWQLMQNRTAIVIAHRLSTVQKMDRILVLDNGKITEQGSHADLVKKKGTYAMLWAHQSGGFIED